MRARISVGLLALTVATFAGAACGFPDVSFSSDETDRDAGGVSSAMEPNEPGVRTDDDDDVAATTPPVNDASTEDDDTDGEDRDAGTDAGTIARDATAPAPAPTPTMTATTPPPAPTPTTTATTPSPAPTPTTTATTPPPAPTPTTTTPPPAPTPTTTTPPPAPTCDPNAAFGTSASDRNCDGVVTKESPEGITCGSLSQCTQGFAATTACGATGTYNYCKQTIGVLGSTLCQVERSEVKTQRCR